MNKYARCLWIVNALNDYGKASLKELNDRWVNSSINDEGEEILPRTFARDKEFIADTFQLDIEYDGKSRKYELVNADEIMKVELSDESELESLMDAKAYEEFCAKK